MKKLAGFTASMIVLGFTTSLILVKPVLYGYEYGMKKGWIKPSQHK